MTFEEAKDQVAKEQGIDKFPKLPVPYQVLYEKAAELYATAKAAQAWEEGFLADSSTDITDNSYLPKENLNRLVDNFKRPHSKAAQAWEEGYNAREKDIGNMNGIKPTNPYKQEKPWHHYRS